MMFRRLTLNSRERKAFRIHFVYSVIEGFIAGILVLNEFVFLKSLRGTNYQLSFLFQFSVVIMILLFFFNEFIRRIRDKRKMLRIVALVTRMPLFLLLLFPKNAQAMAGDSIYHFLFLGIFFIYYFASPIVFPTINLFLKTNYQHPNFGELYGYATSANKFLMLFSTLLFGILLDHNNFIFVYVYPLMAIMALGSIFLLSRIEYSVNDITIVRMGFFKAAGQSVLRMFNILKDNKPYRHFEIAFMVYGFSYMSTAAVITIYYERALHLNYTSVGFYKNIFNVLAIVLLPVMGRIIGKTDPRRFGILTFFAFLCYFFFTGLTEYLPVNFEWLGLTIYPVLLAGMVCNGVFVAMMALLWYIGSAYFCQPDEAGDYQAVHLSLTGVRALFSPLLGMFIFNMVNFTGTFLVAILALVVAIGIMVWSLRKYPVQGEIPEL